ncbi:hypothetical protein [Streptosporangium sp. NPDC049644]|uniref:hypothetical protein n=1 Tax=Streptosporangium sp. NPDC049644 TaxID=3155507 RepID=UPI003412E09F
MLIYAPPTPTPAPTVTVTQTIVPTSAPTIYVQTPDQDIDVWKDVILGDFGGATLGAIIAIFVALYIVRGERRARVEDRYMAEATALESAADRTAWSVINQDFEGAHHRFIEFITLCRELPGEAIRAKNRRLGFRLSASIRREASYGQMRRWLLTCAEQTSELWSISTSLQNLPEEKQALIQWFLVSAPKAIRAWKADPERWKAPVSK